MIKKIILAALMVLFLNSCSYQPIYSSKNEKFSLGKLQSAGDKKIDKLLIKKLEFFQKNESNKIKYNLKIKSEITKNVSSKDKRGNPKTFTLVLSFKIEIENSLGETRSKIFEKYTTYENNENKFDLKKYENSIIKNMVENISQNLIEYLQDII
tara:strand:+ start:1422 stop:1883 length:462 start_codon:yes stop_codon:yes gene_type:complete